MCKSELGFKSRAHAPQREPKRGLHGDSFRVNVWLILGGSRRTTAAPIAARVIVHVIARQSASRCENKRTAGLGIHPSYLQRQWINAVVLWQLTTLLSVRGWVVLRMTAMSFVPLCPTNTQSCVMLPRKGGAPCPSPRVQPHPSRIIAKARRY